MARDQVNQPWAPLPPEAAAGASALAGSLRVATLREARRYFRANKRGARNAMRFEGRGARPGRT